MARQPAHPKKSQTLLRQKGIEVDVVNAKEQKIKEISQYDLVIVGSGIQINRWTSEPEDFLKKHQKELASKKLALFVCCGSATDKVKPELAEHARRKYLEEKASKYNLQPVALGLFGGVYNYNKVPWYAKKAMEADRPRIESAYKETQPGIYDTRDWNAVRRWVEELAKKNFCALKNWLIPRGLRMNTPDKTKNRLNTLLFVFVRANIVGEICERFSHVEDSQFEPWKPEFCFGLAMTWACLDL